MTLEKGITLNKHLFEEIIQNFETVLDKDGNHLKMDSVIISQGSLTFKHFFHQSDQPNDLRSISKPILGMAVGIALHDGLVFRGERLSLDTFVWPLMEDLVHVTNKDNLPRLRKVRLRHLLTHTIGHDVGLMFSKDIKGRDPDSLLDYIVNTNITYEPGEHFVYSNAGPYLFSAIIQEELGMNLSEWVRSLVFEPLGVTRFTWKNYGKYCAASSGLMILNSDLHKIGQLFLNHGQWDGHQLVPSRWLEQMSARQVLTPTMYDETRVFPKYAYGLLLWVCKDGNYYCDGTDGQYLIVLPRADILVTTFGHQVDMKPITECLRILKSTIPQQSTSERTLGLGT